MGTQPKHQPSEDFQANCQANIKRVEALMEELRKMPTTDKPLSPKDQLFIDECQEKLQDIKNLRKLIES